MDIRNIGITGADGYIGSVLAEALADSYSLRRFTLKPEPFESTVADLSEVEQVRGIFDGLDCVIHLAADSHEDAPWESVLPNNIVATQNVFSEAVKAGVKKIIFASSNHTQHGLYMKDGKANMTDPSIRYQSKPDEPPHPDSLYGVSKLFGENLGRYYSIVREIHFIALRIGWTNIHDDPGYKDGTEMESHQRALFMSKRDCIQVFRRAIETDEKFLVAYATSDNRQYGIFDLKVTREKLGYRPQDSSDRAG
ncbi:MAG: NAD(P)-dependent oxidoreductase [Verrucomicrobiae bacterium]|nr:NAD(P)-dependent oxidoreductase [Verrucomicrobiae bacterium]